MGNTSSGHRCRPSLEDEFSSSSNAGRIQDYADDQVISILTEGGAINVLADQLRDPRIGSPGERAKLYVGDDAGIVQNVPTVFKWEGGGKDVYISGTFNGWKSKIPMVRR
ncbi:unnamed protein product [Calicophoron daubneyi]|uniref:5'-AMP-activated protein kinase subunit beta-1 n=1 Tax=Calicophoron daubneyi TaxID=300641 RepID=A0AAV2T2K3_CALDB